MPKGNKEDTIRNILKAAEELFSEKGFNGTSVNMISDKAGVNKALIYYYFKDKDDIVNSLFENIIHESDEYVSGSSSALNHEVIPLQDSIREEMNFLQEKQKILSIMLMESLKGDDSHNYFFKCAQKVIESEIEANISSDPQEFQRLLVHEFFTGFVPIMSFIIFKDKWCKYFDCDTDQFISNFLDSFSNTHLSSKKPGS
ncbi:MAG: TetR/AcrR family transcriptional regulator [Bacillota bacterium]|nr:TetR/AcrR family transcriptional regulator [Bacillota bacterium]